jgi:hypothetical protein
MIVVFINVIVMIIFLRKNTVIYANAHFNEKPWYYFSIIDNLFFHAVHF